MDCFLLFHEVLFLLFDSVSHKIRTKNWCNFGLFILMPDCCMLFTGFVLQIYYDFKMLIFVCLVAFCNGRRLDHQPKGWWFESIRDHNSVVWIMLAC